MSTGELLDVPEIARLGGWRTSYVYVWLRRRGLTAVDVRGTGRERHDLFDGDEVRAAMHAARARWHTDRAGALT